MLSAYREMPLEVSLVVLSNIPKDLGADVEVRVGLPTPNPWSLPFAHRTLFKERIEDYDVFIYSEDDTLAPWATLSAYLESLKILEDREIAGFLRTETAPDGTVYYSTCHSFFRWIPSSLRVRGGHLWARYSNDHSAFFVASREQLRQAIQSGGFPTMPHQGRFDMLCSAATDLYTRCGFERLICIDRIAEFALAHLPNKYIGKIGLPEEELHWQIDALRKIHAGGLPAEEMLQPETLLPGCLGSKRFREAPDPVFNQMLDGCGKNLLVWGAGDGLFEASLQKDEKRVAAYPLNAVMGECCRRRGLQVVSPTRPAGSIDEGPFDAVLLRDILHLVERPEMVLEEVRRLLRPGGRVLVRVPNFHSLKMIKNLLFNKLFRGPWTGERIGATPFTRKALSRLLATSGFGGLEFKFEPLESFYGLHRFAVGPLSQTFSSGIYLRAGKI